MRTGLCIGMGLASLALACSKAPPPLAADAAVAECATRADCEAKGADHQGEICTTRGTCGSCASDGQCALRERCDPAKARCAFKPGWGADCALNGDCSAGQLCVQGLCKSAQDAVLCPSGTCLAAGQRCSRVNGVCEEDVGCLSDADCLDVELCNVPTNACVLRCTSETQGQICTAGQQCLDSRCTDCADSSDCPGGMVCDRDRLSCVVDGSARCLSNRDCAVGLVCNLAAGFCTQSPPPCLSNEDCLANERCDVAAGKCVLRACQPDRFEPNSSQEEAKPLVAGDYPGLTLCDKAQDWFSVKLTRGDRLDVFVDADPLLQDVVDTRLLDPTGRALAQGKLALDKTVANDATYFLRLQSTDVFVEYGLRIGISRGTPCDDDRFEPNDVAASATPIHDQGDYDKLTLCGLDQDWFLVDVPAGKGFSVAMHYEPTAGAADLLALALDGTTVLGRNDATAAVQTVAVDAAAITGGKVLVLVRSIDDRALDEYWLHLAYE